MFLFLIRLLERGQEMQTSKRY